MFEEALLSIHQYDSLTTSPELNKWLRNWIAGGLQLIPAVTGGEAGYTLNRLLVYHKVKSPSLVQRDPLCFSLFSVICTVFSYNFLVGPPFALRASLIPS